MEFHRTLVGSSYNYASTHDFVTRLADTMGSIVHRRNLQYLTRHPEASYFDHDFQSPTYREVLKDHIDAIKSRSLLER